MNQVEVLTKLNKTKTHSSNQSLSSSTLTPKWSLTWYSSLFQCHRVKCHTRFPLTSTISQLAHLMAIWKYGISKMVFCQYMNGSHLVSGNISYVLTWPRSACTVMVRVSTSPSDICTSSSTKLSPASTTSSQKTSYRQQQVLTISIRLASMESFIDYRSKIFVDTASRAKKS